jgi:signal transduction histidine kinase
MAEPTGGEVSGEVLAATPRMAAYLGVPVEHLYGPYRDYIDHPPERIDWDDYVALKQIAADVAGSDERLVALGNLIIQTPKTAAGARALALVVDPALLILKASKNGWGRLYTNIDVACSREGALVKVEVALHASHAPCRPFFVQNAGILEYAPKLIGCEPAVVEWSTDGRSGVYLVRLPPSNTIWSRLKRRINVLVNTRVMVEELTGQQERLNRQNRELQAALNRARIALATRDRFLQTIDHELRTPLTGIQGGVRALQSQPRSEEDARWIELIDRSEARLGDTIRSILDYTRLEAETIVPRSRDFRPKWIAESLRAEALRRSPDATVDIDCRAPPKLWIRGDDEYIERVLRELLNNALRFGKNSPIRVSLSLEGEDAAPRLRVVVADRGPGIALEDQQRIFEPFVQLQTGDARSFEGAGLGLAIASAMTKGLGGSLVVESTAGEGATFIAEFPLERSSRSEAGAQKERAVLIVDDNKVNLMVASRLLRRLGCRVTVAEDGLRALEVFDAAAIDLVLMDCEMPNLDGWAATRKLRNERGAATPVVAFTAYSSQADRRRCFDSGMNDFLPKPVSEAALERLLERWA